MFPARLIDLMLLGRSCGQHGSNFNSAALEAALTRLEPSHISAGAYQRY